MLQGMLRTRVSLLVVVVTSLLMTTLVVPMSSANAEGRSISGRSLGQPGLKVEKPSPYLANDFPTLQFATYENEDGLPRYAVTLTELGSGQPVPLGFGYATSSSYSEYEGPYRVDTTAHLVVGATYEAKMALTTASYWHCSIYYSDGCHWLTGGTDTWYWRFTYTSENADATIYDPPPSPPPAVSQTAATPTSVTVAWTSPVTGAYPLPTYEVRVNGSTPVSVGSAKTHTITGLTQSTSYTVDVRTVLGGQASAWTSPLQVLTATLPPKATTTIKVVKHGPYGEHDLTYAWILKRDGSRLKGARLTGQWGFRNGTWKTHKTFRTDSRGRLTLWLSVQPKRSEPTKYRLVFAGDSTTAPVTSMPVRLWYRR